MTSILISRFILNLREVGQSTSDTTRNTRLSRLSMPAFAKPESRITGNLGEDLRDFSRYPECLDEEDLEDASSSDAQEQMGHVGNDLSTGTSNA